MAAMAASSTALTLHITASSFSSRGAVGAATPECSFRVSACRLQGRGLRGSVHGTGFSVERNGRRRSYVVRAAENESESSEQVESGEAVKPGQARQSRERGQVTAIVTGAISVLLGVAYLVLVQVLDTRGLNLVPAPPEAYGE